jgi:hypothetical protein
MVATFYRNSIPEWPWEHVADSQTEVRYGLGQNFNTISTTAFEEVLKVGKPFNKFQSSLTFQHQGLYVSILFYNISLCFTKISIILQYMRVFIGPRIRRACWVLLAIVVAYFIQAIITAIWTCVPIDGFWSLNKPARCISKEFLWFFNASFNIFTDILIITLPMPALSSLRLPLKQKIGIIMIFALGGL